MKSNIVLSGELVTKLALAGLHITTVESCTGGGLANTITNIPGASDILEDAFVTYSTASKIALGVSTEPIDTHTVYSREVAEAMAQAGLERSVCADIAVGITGTITATVYIAVQYRDKVVSKEVSITEEDRVRAKEQVIETALQMVLELLQD